MRREGLGPALEWLNSSEDFKFATGADSPLTLKDLEERFDAVSGNWNEFFLGIYGKYGRLFGMLTGSISGEIVWIKLLAVAVEHRGKGFGSRAVGLLLRYMKGAGLAGACCLSVDKENVKGRKFWHKNGFREINRLGKRKPSDGTESYIIILNSRL